MNYSRSYKKENLIAVGFIIINLAILSLGSWFLTSRTMSSSNQLAEEKGVFEAIYKNWEQISQAQNKLDETKPQIDKLNQAFVSKTEPIGFINSLENLALKTNNAFEIDLTSAGADSKKKDSALYFQIKLAGSFSDAMHFLNYLENMEYRVQIQSLDISKISTRPPEISGAKEIPANSIFTLINLKAFTQ